MLLFWPRQAFQTFLPPEPPVVLGTTYADELYPELDPLTSAEADYDYPLMKFINTISLPYEEIEDLARDTSGTEPGWSVLLDIDRVPANAFGYLGQFIGVQLSPGLTNDQQRNRIRNTAGWTRGTVSAIVGAAQQRLTGSKTVILRERTQSSAYKLEVYTYSNETPNAEITEADIMAQKPAGLLLTYTAISPNSYDALDTSYASYNELNAAFPTYNDILI